MYLAETATTVSEVLHRFSDALMNVS